ncbi:hypothetical protein Tcan_18799 [Toxocara canis]|uniref:Uncharacterized protein n=1 Tax=Toxocara canis TaxID=6265 RepID=A0A0B2W2U3_TOXCA|nr:hypothetical protein Tcan_18799 [Toxocara canis]
MTLVAFASPMALIIQVIMTSSKPIVSSILSELSVADLTSTALTGPLWAGAERVSANEDSTSISSSEHSHR